jgi:hypothetical protein
MSARFYRNPDGTGLCRRSALSGSWRRARTPERRPRGPAEQGSGSGGDAGRIVGGACIPLQGRIFLWKTLLRPARSRPEAQGEGPAKRDRPA